jgi:hypothetical protein
MPGHLNIKYVRFDVFSVVKLKFPLFWDTTMPFDLRR